MSLLHAGLFFQYLTYFKYFGTTPAWAEKKRKITKLDILLSRLSILTWKIGYSFFFFWKKINITFVCFWKLFVFASLARRVSLPRSSPGLTVGPHPSSGSSAGRLLGVCVEGWDCKRVRRSKIAGRPFWKLFHSTYKLQGWQEVLNMCQVSFFFPL